MASAPNDELDSPELNVLDFTFEIEKKPPIIQECGDIMTFCAPTFSAQAKLEIPPVGDGTNFEIGFVQVCTELQQVYHHGGYGVGSWEIPELVTGKYEMVNDSTCLNFPWYGLTNEFAHFVGPSDESVELDLRMCDKISASASWAIPLRGYPKDPSLVFIFRKQKFYTYLVLKDVYTRTYEILRAISWSMELALDITPKNRLGQRVKVMGLLEQESPKLIPEDLTPPLKCYALKAPNANSCQAFVWRKRFAKAELAIAPRETTMNMDDYLVDTKDETEKLLRLTKASLMCRYQPPKK